jgi:hypothetical protein
MFPGLKNQLPLARLELTEVKKEPALARMERDIIITGRCRLCYGVFF